MHVRIETDVLLKLQTIGILNRGAEFSGFGWCRIEGKEIVVYDFLLLDLGSEVWTEIPPDVILPLMERPDRQNMKVWLHSHPLGDGIPGPHNWSGTDERTCTKEPMGGSPELVGWSVALVRTPSGWVGRIDNHKTKKTVHMEVFPKLDSAYAEVQSVQNRKRLARRAKNLELIAREFDDHDLELLDIVNRETLKDWIAEYFGDELDDMDEYYNPWYYQGRYEDDLEWDEAYHDGGNIRWTTRGTSASSRRKI